MFQLQVAVAIEADTLRGTIKLWSADAALIAHMMALSNADLPRDGISTFTPIDEGEGMMATLTEPITVEGWGVTVATLLESMKQKPGLIVDLLHRKFAVGGAELMASSVEMGRLWFKVHIPGTTAEDFGCYAALVMA